MEIRKSKFGKPFILALFVISLAACKKEGCTDSAAINYSEKAKKNDGSCKYESKPVDENTIIVSSNIEKDTHWTSNKVYVLSSRIAVTSGNTLTIDPGTIIKGEVGTGANATALIIARGAKIDAVGTSTSPIIFTTVADEIESGQIASPNMDLSLDGLWGGLIVLGKAPISADNASMQIEGIPPSDPNGLYGGNEPADNSGRLKYISIRHGGANIGEGNEINGLSLGGVGNQTLVENIEILSNQDDGIEWFGGTVNVTNVISWNVGDDAFDTDQAWAGSLNNFIVIAGNSTDHAMEVDGPEGSLMDGHTLMNGSIKGNTKTELANFRDGARGDFQNIYFFNFPDPATDGRGDFTFKDQASLDNFNNGFLTFSGLEIALASGVVLTDVFKDGTDVHATSVAMGANTVGADKTVFSGWSLASVQNELADF